LNIINIYL